MTDPTPVSRVRASPQSLKVAGLSALACAIVVAAGCASRPVNPSISRYDHGYGYRMSNWRATRGDPDLGLVVAMSGGGTRAAALSYGVLEELRRAKVPGPAGPHPLLDDVKIVNGVSGGGFTALAFALYGDRLFDEYEPRFLKRNVQGALLARVFNPLYWPKLMGGRYSRTELAADYYDEILFGGATFAELATKRGAPFASVSATEISTGARVTFNQNLFDFLCSDLSALRVARAAAASAAVPGVFAPMTLDNYAGSCGFNHREYEASLVADADRAQLRRIRRREIELDALSVAGQHRYLHLVDGGVADNLGLRTVLEAVELAMASEAFRVATGFDKLKRFAVIVVNSRAEAATDWSQRESPPGSLAVLPRVAGMSIDRYSFEEIDLLHDYVSRVRSGEHRDPSRPSIDVYAVDIGFEGIEDPAERSYFMDLPTSFRLSAEQVDRLREVGGRLLRQSPEYQRLLRDLGALRH